MSQGVSAYSECPFEARMNGSMAAWRAATAAAGNGSPMPQRKPITKPSADTRKVRDGVGEKLAVRRHLDDALRVAAAAQEQWSEALRTPFPCGKQGKAEQHPPAHDDPFGAGWRGLPAVR